MSTLLEAQKQSIRDIATTDAFKSTAVGVGCLVAGIVLTRTGYERAGTIARIVGVAAAWCGVGQINMANKIIEKI